MTIINLKEILSSLYAPFLFVVKCNSVLAALKVKWKSECCIHEAILFSGCFCACLGCGNLIWRYCLQVPAHFQFVANLIFFVTVTVFLLLMPGRVLQNIDIFFHMTCQKKSNDTWILSVDYRGLILVFSETPKSVETVQ